MTPPPKPTKTPRSRVTIADRAGHIFPPHTMVHGFEHYSRGEVEIEDVTSSSVRARVRGKRTETVLLREEAGRLAVRCTCPALSLGAPVCTHQWAALLEVDRRGVLEVLRVVRDPLGIVALGGEPETKVKSDDERASTTEVDTAKRTVSVPPDLAEALRKNKAAKAAWKALSYAHQREHVDAIVEAKKPETRARRVAAALKRLAAPPEKVATARSKTGT